MRCASSIPAMVMAGLSNDLKPALEVQRRLIARWSCSTILLRSSVLVDRSIEVIPFASNANVRLVGAPGSTDGPRESVPALLIFRHVPGYPSEDCAVGHRDPALRHHCNEVPIAQPIRDVPANAQLNDFSIEHSSAVDWVTGDRFGHSEPLLGVRIIRERPQMHRSPTPSQAHQGTILAHPISVGHKYGTALSNYGASRERMIIGLDLH